MKHLLILISLLLLSSPVIGEETGVLYLYESSSGFVLKSFGNEKVQPKYEGEITNGKPNGFGVLTYPYDEESVVGEWKNGKEWNTKHKNKGGKLIGKFENGEWLDGELIERWGVLYHGLRNGERGWYEEKWEGGNEGGNNKDWGKYEGKIINGKPNKGTITNFDGSKYVGEWKDGTFHGQGTHIHYSGNQKYEGEWRNGKKHGQGTMTWSSGGKYVGEWKDGETWNGIYYDKDGNITYKYVNGKSIKQ